MFIHDLRLNRRLVTGPLMGIDLIAKVQAVVRVDRRSIMPSLWTTLTPVPSVGSWWRHLQVK